MENKKRLIDANAFLDRIKERHDDIMQDPIVDKATKWRESVCFGGVVNVLVKMPTVDAVEVVRCKDCKHCMLDLSGRENHLCMRKEVGFVVRRNADDFCSYGERQRVE